MFSKQMTFSSTDDNVNFASVDKPSGSDNVKQRGAAKKPTQMLPNINLAQSQ